MADKRYSITPSPGYPHQGIVRMKGLREWVRYEFNVVTETVRQMDLGTDSHALHCEAKGHEERQTLIAEQIGSVRLEGAARFAEAYFHQLYFPKRRRKA